MSDDTKKKVMLSDTERFDQFLDDLGRGVDLVEAMGKNLIRQADIDAITRSNPAADKAWQQALLRGERTSWSALQLNDVFSRIAGGASVIASVIAVRGFDDSASLYRLLAGDAEVEKAYLAAKKAWAVRESEQLLEIIDDDSKDTLSGPKGEIPNMAAVNRSRLRYEGRRELISKLAPDIFGDQKTKVDVNVNIDLAARIQEGRIRAKERRVVITPEQRKAAIDATFVVPPDTTPTPAEQISTVWREGGVDIAAENARASSKPATDGPSEQKPAWFDED